MSDENSVPNKPGFYYFKDEDGIIDIAYIFVGIKNNKKRILIAFIGDERIYTRDEIYKYTWSSTPIGIPDDIED